MTEFEKYLAETEEVGFVIEVHTSIVRLEGLPHAYSGEVVVFENGSRGFVYSIGENYLDVVLLDAHSSGSQGTKLGDRAVRTNKPCEIVAPEVILGDVFTPLGKVSQVEGQKSVALPTFVNPGGILTRVPIVKQLETGVAIVDITTPLGHGQRELVLGDRKTGKTQFLLQVLSNQAAAGTACIYCAIGKRDIEIQEIVESLKADPVTWKNTCVVASTSRDASGQIYLTPFSAMALAEKLRDEGRDVLVILDDLSTHARAYRELALLARRFPGRASYPGDIFFIHAQILERAGNFKTKAGSVSITCLPVAESVLGDITGFITTNIMSMTDGHLYFDTEIFDEGRRPALNPFLSVTRVGHQTQSSLMRDISREVTSFLVNYKRAQEYSHFGTDVSDEIKSTLVRGKLIYSIFDQELSQGVIPQTLTAFLLAHLWAGSFRSETVDTMKKKVEVLINKFKSTPELSKKIAEFEKQYTSFKELVIHINTIPLTTI